ncbi:LysR family transcriptional regulator [Streptomyces sp. 7-21]|uniref:LysR family transcriptional regulator n=1 Tax=Streptomyces sp. 7-21 TaxID=2802283 RepID=UPI00191FEC2C|nr:LysR family transcriptional regulator [Streptomyces sp. 7-21]MBL1067903.1 LysR family transcriptional regulator [Streptomyces sp. 7-21]
MSGGRNGGSNGLEVRQLRYFVAVAEEAHFGRAAARLGMAQPPLSRAIRALERQLGVALLTRTTRSVALTPAGEVLLREARAVLDAVAAAERRTRNAGRPRPQLRVALKAGYDGGLLPAVLAAYERDPAALPAELVMAGRGEQAAAVRDGRADVAFVPAPFAGEGLDSEPLLTEPRLLAIAAGDPLAARPALRLADLAGKALPDGTAADQEGQPPGLRSRAAVPPPPAPRDLAEIFSLVEIGRIVWFPPVSVAERHPRPGIAYRPVADLPPLRLSLAWPSHSRSPAVAAFVRAAAAVAAEAGQPAGAA